jgi:hypothetical protein
VRLGSVACCERVPGLTGGYCLPEVLVHYQKPGAAVFDALWPSGRD